MRRSADTVEPRELVLPGAGAVALLAVCYAVVRQFHVTEIAVGVVVATLGLAAACPLRRALSRTSLIPWWLVIAALIAVMLLVPMTRYTLPGNLPLQVDPFRVLAGVVIAAWLASVQVDSRVRPYRSGLDAPLITFLLAVLLSITLNGSRLELPGAGAGVLKVVLFLLTSVVLFYVVVSLIRTRDDVDRLVRLTVLCGSVVAVFALIEFKAGFNVFNHLGVLLPGFQFTDPSVALSLTQASLERGGGVRVYGPAEHPIALSAALVMLAPLGIYLAHRHSWRWWLAVAVTTLGALATLSRTAIVMIAVALLVLGLLRASYVARLLPLGVVGLVVVVLALPSLVQGLSATVNPEGGLLGEQSEIVAGNRRANGRLADIGPSLSEAMEKPAFGLGYGTRSFEPENVILDNQWLAIILETGIAGFAALLWLFGRAIRQLVRASRRARSPDGDLCAALAASLASYAAGMAFFDSFSFAQVTYLFFVLLAVSAVTIGLASEAPVSGFAKAGVDRTSASQGSTPVTPVPG